VVEGTYGGEILQRQEIPTYADRPFAETFPDICTVIDRAIRRATDLNRRITALSVSIGGPLRILTGEILDPPHLPGWHNIRLVDHLNKIFPELPAYVEHDGNAGALAEFYFGSGRENADNATSPVQARHLIFLTFGTGLGAGIIVNGRILHGASDTAGEVGHWRLSETGPVGFGKAGSWEGWSSGRGMLGLARIKNPGRWGVSSVRGLVDDMLADDPEALEVTSEAGRWLGRGIALLVDAFNPDVVALGALSAVLGDRIFVPLREELEREALPQAVAACRIIPAKLGSSIGDVASLMGAINAMNHAH
ncbi:MAG: ROK family protein, partial [Rhodothermia bacterium]